MFFEKNYIITAALLIVSILIMPGCGVNTNSSNNKGKDSSNCIVVATSSDTEMDKLDAVESQGLMQVYPLLYDSLVEYGKKGDIIPSLAESWEISSDGKSYTFHLRKGVKFSDGTPFNANAVKFSAQRWVNRPEYSWLKVAKDIKNVEVIDAYTVKLNFTSKYYLTLTELTYPRPLRIISPTAVEPAGDPNGKFVKPIGTGPWVLEEYGKDDKTIFIKNTNYWGEKPKVDKLILKVIPDSQTRVLALQNGEVDLSGGQMGEIPIGNLDLIKKDNNLKILSVPSTTSYFLMFNNSNKIFNDVKVRKAINYAINKESIVKDLFNGIGSPAQGLFQYTVPYVTKDNNKGYKYNLEKAKSLLKEAGFKNLNGNKILEKDSKPLKLSLVLQIEEFPEWKSICEVIQSDLANIGIDVELKVLERSAYYDCVLKNKDYGLAMYRTYSDGWNPYSFLNGVFHSVDGKPAIAYGTKELDSLIDNVASISNVEERQKSYDKIFKIMYDEASCVPVYYTNEIFITNNRISGFEFGNTTYSPVFWEKLKLNK